MHVLEQNLQTKIKLELDIMSVKLALKFTNVDQQKEKRFKICMISLWFRENQKFAQVIIFTLLTLKALKKAIDFILIWT